MAAGRQAACLEPDNRTDISDVINGCLQLTWVAAQERQLEPVGSWQLMQPKFANVKKGEEESGRCRGASAAARERERERGKFVLNSSTDCGS